MADFNRMAEGFPVIKCEHLCSRDPKRSMKESDTSRTGQGSEPVSSAGSWGCFLTDVFKEGSGTVP
jgi:hypothetical protein